MPSVTTAYAKNVIRRVFQEIIDQTPSRQAVEKIWTFFAGECAYCGKKLTRESKEGHMDHLTPASKGGRNHLSNRVLSCAACNEKEKRDLPWEDFRPHIIGAPEKKNNGLAGDEYCRQA